MTIAETIPAEFAVDPQDLIEDGKMLIGGEWVSAVSGETIDVFNPATQQLLGSVPAGDEEDVNRAVAAANAAYPAWRETHPSVRGRLLNKWADLCEEHVRELERLENQEIGRPSFAPNPVAAAIRYIAGLADKIEGTSLPTADLDQVALTLRDPFGAIAIIVPWNGPGWAAPKRMVGPLIAGNTVVIKPASEAPLTVLYLAKLAEQAGIPKGVINVVTGSGRKVGEPLVAHPGIRRVSFTGSTSTGTRIAELAASHQIPTILELGGKSANVVYADADLDIAIPILVRSILDNSGQACIAGSRLVVERSIEKEVVERLKEAFAMVTLGPWYENPTMGPLINEKQGEVVLGYIDIGLQEGATLAYGGSRLTGGKYDLGCYIEPTILTDVKPGMRVEQEEIFGPVLCVIPFDTEAEAVQIANGTKYGLNSGVFTQDVGKAVRFARRSEAGLVSINTTMGMGAVGIPAGGFKASGYGRISSSDSPLEWTQTKAVVFGKTA
jgi:acyl-CoA reductase-like NAD-dependent aldehyde dehydrogenase